MMQWVPVANVDLHNNMRADLWCINPANGYGGRVADCVYTQPYGKAGKYAWVNTEGAPVENGNRVVTHFMLVKGPEE